jgi:hypothetical protein
MMKTTLSSTWIVGETVLLRILPQRIGDQSPSLSNRTGDQLCRHMPPKHCNVVGVGFGSTAPRVSIAVDIYVYLNDKAEILLPPYETSAQRAMLEERADFKNRDFWIWNHEDTRRYFIAGGGRESEFEALWSVAISGNEKFDKAIADHTYAAAGAGISYLVAGKKLEPHSARSSADPASPVAVLT